MSTLSAELQQTINEIRAPGKGILAADESTATIAKRLKSIHVESTEAARLAYRHMLFTTPQLSDYVSGVILFEETLGQIAQDGQPLAQILSQQGIVPGIKVDKGLVTLSGAEEKTTQGLDFLADRLAQYKDQGARFAKWRAVYSISNQYPSHNAIVANAQGLARYAAICQQAGVVPIVEPEVLINGDHSLKRCFGVTEWVLHEVFRALYHHGVTLEHMILKPSMVISGDHAAQQASVQEVAEATLTVLKRCVPAAVPTINFLSGGQTPEQATAHLDAMNKMGPLPWHLSFSYGRALQEPALSAWAGKDENIAAGQEALLLRARLNSAATKGQYDVSMEAQGAMV